MAENEQEYRKVLVVADVYAYVNRADIHRAMVAISGIVPDQYLEDYATDALLQLGVSQLQPEFSKYADGIPIKSSAWQKSFAEVIDQQNWGKDIWEYIPSFANVALLNHVKAAFKMHSVQFPGSAEADYGRWKGASYTKMDQESVPEKKMELRESMRSAANGSMPKEVLWFLLAKNAVGTVSDDVELQEFADSLQKDAIKASEKAIFKVLKSEQPIGEYGLTVLNVGANAHPESVIHYPAASVLMGSLESPHAYRLYRDRENPERVVLAYPKPESDQFVCETPESDYVDRTGEFLQWFEPVPTMEAYDILEKDFGYKKPPLKDHTRFAGTESVSPEAEKDADRSLRCD